MNEKLIKYIAEEMNSSEKEEFEKLVGNSPELLKEVQKYREFFSNIKETNNPEINESYFINLLPNFRNKLEFVKRKKYHPVYSFASAVITVIVILMFIPRSENIIKEENSITGNYSTGEITDYLTMNSEQPLVTNLPADVEANYDSLLDGMIYSELDINDQNLATTELIDKLDYNALIQSVNPNEASVIYEQLKNKKIF